MYLAISCVLSYDLHAHKLGGDEYVKATEKERNSKRSKKDERRERERENVRESGKYKGSRAVCKRINHVASNLKYLCKLSTPKCIRNFMTLVQQ